jgi:hypothetical protein
VRSVLLLLLLSLLAVQTPGRWAVLWVVVPVTVAASMLAGWRFGARGVIVPIVAFFAALAIAGPYAAWGWWIPVASLTGLWMGLREEGEGPALGERAWMLLPVLLLAALLPWALSYSGLVGHVQRQLAAGDTQLAGLTRQMGYAAEQQKLLESTLTEQAKLRAQVLPQVLPSAIFLWMVALIMAGRSLGARLATVMHWPPVSRAAVARWRLPDAALWLLIAGIAVLLAPLPSWSATGWTLLLNAALGFGVQGIAVVESLLLARGVPLSVIVITLLFMSTVALPAFALAAVAVGLSDVWLDFRKLEPASRADDEQAH